MDSTKPIKLEIWKKLKEDETYRAAFFRAKARDEIASQIKMLRAKRHLNQVQFADKCDMKQSAVSRIEQSEYSAWNFNTLLRVAEALGARLRVIFEPVEAVIEQYRRKEEAINHELAGKTTSAFGNIYKIVAGSGSTGVVKPIAVSQHHEKTHV